MIPQTVRTTTELFVSDQDLKDFLHLGPGDIILNITRKSGKFKGQLLDLHGALVTVALEQKE